MRKGFLLGGSVGKKIEETKKAEQKKQAASAADKPSSDRVIIPMNDDFGMTNLHWAVVNGDYEKVRGLVERGVDVNTVCEINQTAMMAAAFYGHLDIVKYLHQAGTDLHITDDCGNTALMRAAQYGHEDIVMYLHQEWEDILEKSFFATVSSTKTVIFIFIGCV